MNERKGLPVSGCGISAGTWVVRGRGRVCTYVCVCVSTFALWGVLTAVPQDVDLVDGSVGLKQLLELLLGPGAGDLAHKHLDGVRVGLVGVLQRPVHLPGGAVTAEQHKGALCQNYTWLMKTADVEREQMYTSNSH